jgi:phosphatidylinositol alpha-mannosyltransferase
MVLLEAMATGKPVVAANIPGYASVITHDRDGILVEPKDAPALALGIVRVLADRDLQQRLARNGEDSAGHYGWPSIAARVLNMYEQAAEDAARAKWRQGTE